MPLRDVMYLILKPFCGNRRGATNAELLSRAVEHRAMKDMAGNLTQLTDEVLKYVMQESRAERLRIQLEAESPVLRSR
jgi:anaerobic magnesium-protoporphyrin IX monomethyl ester cyclase